MLTSIIATQSKVKLADKVSYCNLHPPMSRNVHNGETDDKDLCGTKIP